MFKLNGIEEQKKKIKNNEEIKELKNQKIYMIPCKCGHHIFEVNPNDPPIKFSPHSRMEYFLCNNGKSSGASIVISQELLPEVSIKLTNWCCNCGKHNLTGDILCCDHFLCDICKRNNNLKIGIHYVIWCKICWRSIPY